MTPFHRIVCGVDFSETSAAALQYAAMLSGGGEGQLRVVHATWFEPPAYFTESQIEELHEQNRRARRAAEEALSMFVVSCVECKVERADVVDGPAAEAVVKYAGDAGADLIVVGSHGRTGWNRLLMGSIAEKVIRLSPVPVLTVRAGKAPAPIRTILCPVNETANAREGVLCASRIASSLDARLVLLGVQEPGGALAGQTIRSWMIGDGRDHELMEIERKGDAATEILAAAAETGADLIVVGAQHKRFADATVLGSTTVRVTRHAPVPVLLAFSAGSRQAAG